MEDDIPITRDICIDTMSCIWILLLDHKRKCCTTVLESVDFVCGLCNCA